MNILVMLPTYNEKENISSLITALFALELVGLEIVVVDDASPDGTGLLVRGMMKSRPGLHLIERSGLPGRGLAGREGYLFGLSREARVLVEMDADFSHPPAAVPALVCALEYCDVVIGSRFVSGGSDRDRPWTRRFLTLAANAYARTLLGLSVHDTNSGFRAFSRRALESIDPESLRSSGPSIVHESLWRAARAGLRIAEVPIDFVDRRRGESKLSLSRLATSYCWIARLACSGWKPRSPDF